MNAAQIHQDSFRQKFPQGQRVVAQNPHVIKPPF
jgi:hypothetical protein